MYTENIEFSCQVSPDEWFVSEVAKMLEREGLLSNLYKIPVEEFRKKCFDSLQEADSYLLKHLDGMMLAALPCNDGSIRFACLLKAGPTNCWLVITEQAPDSPLRALVSNMIDDLLAGDMLLPDYQL